MPKGVYQHTSNMKTGLHMKGRKLPILWRKHIGEGHLGLKHPPLSIEALKHRSEGHKGIPAWNKGLKGYMAGEKNGRWKGGKPHCVDCGKQINYTRKRCKSCSLKVPERTGKNHPRYIHGNGYKLYNREYSECLRRKIRKRDNYTCQFCNKYLKNSSYLNIHHIDYDKYNNKENNLICLCHLCNVRANKNRKKWIVFFKERILNAKKNTIKPNPNTVV